MCLKEEETIHHLFLDCMIAKECWKQLSSPLETNLNFSNSFLDFFQAWEKAYTYSTKRKATINRFWKSLLAVLCWQIWLTRNKSIFKDQTPRIGKILSKTWGLTSEILNTKGTTTMDYNTLQQEERDWINKATIKNKGKKVL